jgi:hypothetical protein
VSDCRAGPGSYQPDARRPCVITRPAQAVGTEHCPDAVKAPTRCQQQMHIMLQLLLVASTKLLWSPAPLRGGSEHTTRAARADTILLRTLRGNMGFDNAGIICTSAKEAIDHTAYCVGLDRRCVVFKISGG